jgi:hypothetical protein
MKRKFNPVFTAAGLIFALGGTLFVIPTPTVLAAPLAPAATAPEDGVEPASTSLLASISLPGGANRATSAGDLAEFNEALQEVARTYHGTITRSEVLIWTGESVKTVTTDLSARLKAAGYTVTESTPIESKAGRVTPLTALRSDRSDSLKGMWIETKDGYALLVWGRFNPDRPKTGRSGATAAKAAVISRKAATAPKKVAAAAKPKKRSGSAPKAFREESAAERQAKAYKAYQDYQYVKLMGPISGPMYRSTKW